MIKTNVMSVQIKKTKLAIGKFTIKGEFTLTDKSKTKFIMSRKSGEWEQFGNSTDNLCVSVDAIENIKKEYCETY